MGKRKNGRKDGLDTKRHGGDTVAHSVRGDNRVSCGGDNIMTNRYGFINARDIFNDAEFMGRKETEDKYLEYCTERNHKDEWSLESVLDELMRGEAQ